VLHESRVNSNNKMVPSHRGGMIPLYSDRRLTLVSLLGILQVGRVVASCCEQDGDPSAHQQSHPRIQLTRTRVFRASSSSAINDEDNTRILSSSAVAYHPHLPQLAAAAITTALRSDDNTPGGPLNNTGRIHLEEIFLWNTNTWELEGVNRVSEVRWDDSNNLPRPQQVGIAFHDYHDDNEDNERVWLAATIGNDHEDRELVVRIWSTNTTPWIEQRLLPFVPRNSISNTNNTSTTTNNTSDSSTMNKNLVLAPPSLAWHPTGGYLAASAIVGQDTFIRIWNRANWQALPTSRFTSSDGRLTTTNDSSSESSVAWSRPDGAFLLVNEGSSSLSIYTFDALFTPVDVSDILFPASSSTSNQHLQNNNDTLLNFTTIAQIQWKPDGTCMAVVDASTGAVFVVQQHNDGNIETKDDVLLAEQRTAVVQLPLPLASLSQEPDNLLGASTRVSLLWSPPNGSYLLAVVTERDSRNRRTRLLLWQSSDWSHIPYELVLLINDNDDADALLLLPPSVAWSSDGQQLAVAQNDGSGEIQIWELSAVTVVEGDDDTSNEQDTGVPKLVILFLLSGLIVVLALLAFLVALLVRLRVVRRRNNRDNCTQCPHPREVPSSCNSYQGNSACGSGESTAKSVSPTQPPIEELVFQSSDGTTEMNSQKLKSIKGFVTGENDASIVLFEGSEDGDVVDYNDYYWKELPESAQKAAEVLGYTQAMWDKETGCPACENKSWRRLSQAEQNAAKVLGYNQVKWDAD